MAESHVISGLVAKHSELAGEIDYHQYMLRQIKDNLTAVDTAIKLFDPDYDLLSIKTKGVRSKNKFFRHGESNTIIMDIMRIAGRDMSTADIVEEAANRKGIDLDCIDQRAFTASLFTILKRLQKKEIVKEVDRVDSVIVWRIV